MAAFLFTVAVFGRAGQCRVRKSVVFGRPDSHTFVGNACVDLVAMCYLCEICDLEGRRHGLESLCGYPGESVEMRAHDEGYMRVVWVVACSPVVPHLIRALGRRKMKEEAEAVNSRRRSYSAISALQDVECQGFSSSSAAWSLWQLCGVVPA